MKKLQKLWDVKTLKQNISNYASKFEIRKYEVRHGAQGLLENN